MAYATFTSPECIAAVVLDDPPDNYISRSVIADINRIVLDKLKPKIKLCLGRRRHPALRCACRR